MGVGTVEAAPDSPVVAVDAVGAAVMLILDEGISTDTVLVGVAEVVDPASVESPLTGVVERPQPSPKPDKVRP